MGDIFYQHNVLRIGGVETFIYELARKYKDRDLTVYYSYGDADQLRRLSRYVRVVKYDGQRIQCDRAFFNYNLSIIDNVEAREYIQIVHADFACDYYKNYKPIQDERINKYYAVSENSRRSFEKLTGHACGLAYNPITIDDEPRVMRLISAQRLSPEKGGKRLEQMIRVLDRERIPYEWTIYSTERLNVASPNVIYKAPVLDIRKYIKSADYMVLLSDSEGFSYGLYEALCMRTPVVMSRLPITDELGVVDGVNGFIIDLDLSNLDVRKIYENAGKMNFSYKPKDDIWGELLSPTKSTYQEELKMKKQVKATSKYEELEVRDNELGYIPKAGEVWDVDEARFKVLSGENPFGVAFVELVEAPKEAPKKAPAKKTPAKKK